MNERGAWKIDANGGFANFTEGDSYDTAAMDSLGDIHTRPNGPDARASKPQKFRHIINPADWEGLPVPPREWIVPGYIPHKTVTLLSGDGSVGKSLLALQLAAGRALAREWIGLMPEPGRTLILSAEG